MDELDDDVETEGDPSEDELEAELAEAEAEETSEEPPKPPVTAAPRPAKPAAPARPAAKPATEAPAGPEDPVTALLPVRYQRALANGTYATPLEALRAFQENSRYNQGQQVGRLQREIQSLRSGERFQRLEERLEQVLRAVNGETPEEPTPPDPAAQRLAGVEATARETLEAVQEREDRDTAEREADDVERYIAADLEAVMADEPAYEAAEAFVADRLFMHAADRYESEGYSAAQAEQLAARFVLDTAAQLQVKHRADGTSLGRAVLEVAQRMGFDLERARAAAANGGATPPPPAARAPLSARPARKTGNVAGMRERMRKTLPAGAGRSVAPAPVKDLERALDEMTDEQFDEFLGDIKANDKSKDAVFRRIASQIAV